VEAVGAVWINGRLFDEERACISPFDHALLTGDGVFETLRVYGGVPFAMRRHLERLRRSAAGMRLSPPELDVLAAVVSEVLTANRLGEGRVRITVTGGTAPLGSDRGGAVPTVIVAASTMGDWPEATAVVTVPWPRNERGALAGLKTVSYGENVVALAYAKDRGAGEALFGNLTGDLCEGTGTNVFLVLSGRLVTPPLASGCLAGVTRELLLEITDAAEEAVPLDALARAEEVFLTSSTREVQAVDNVDGRRLSPVPGPLTRAAADAFSALVARDLDP
jgi:branched-chain amino acid aminotransferase